MKIKKFSWQFILALLAVAALSCKKELIHKDNLYSARVLLAGSDAYLSMPSVFTNYSVDDAAKKIIINLGVSRSGIEDPEAFSVNVTVNNDTITKLVTAGMLSNITLLSPDMYVLPSKVDVPSGSKGAVFQLQLDMTKLSGLTGVLGVAVKISNPTKYQLNNKLTTGIILINYRALVGVSHTNDVARTGRLFEVFKSNADVNQWATYNMDKQFLDPGKMQITQGNADGYGLLSKSVSVNYGTNQILAVRISSAPSSGNWLLKCADGAADVTFRPSDSGATVTDMPDGSKIYSWNIHDKITNLTTVTGLLQIATEGASGSPAIFDWLKTFTNQAELQTYINEEF